MREVAAALSGETLVKVWSCEMSTDIYRIPGLKLTKAYAYLSDVKDHKQVVPFRRFAGGIGRASQAKQFKTTRGSCSFCSISTLD